ncbi:MAG: hypothetical protein WC539_01975 [Nitrospirota bacterium]
MKQSTLLLDLVAVTFLVMSFSACATGRQIIAQPADSAEVSGTFTLIQYGCRYSEDIENMAILVNEKSGYTFTVYSPEFMYKTKKGMPGHQALNEAFAFVQCSSYSIWHTVLRKIKDSADTIIAYEIKPIYRPLEVRVAEPLISSYTVEGKMVTAFITLDPVLLQEGDAREPFLLRR